MMDARVWILHAYVEQRENVSVFTLEQIVEMKQNVNFLLAVIVHIQHSNYTKFQSMRESD